MADSKTSTVPKPLTLVHSALGQTPAVEVDVPAGFVIVPKGGRPPQIARDIGVYLAFGYYRNELGTAQAATERVLELFTGLSGDEAKVRQKIRNAKAKLPSTGGTWLVPPHRGRKGFAMFFDTPGPYRAGNPTWAASTGGEQLPFRRSGLPAPRDGVKIWYWSPEVDGPHGGVVPLPRALQGTYTIRNEAESREWMTSPI